MFVLLLRRDVGNECGCAMMVNMNAAWTKESDSPHPTIMIDSISAVASRRPLPHGIVIAGTRAKKKWGGGGR